MDFLFLRFLAGGAFESVLSLEERDPSGFQETVLRTEDVEIARSFGTSKNFGNLCSIPFWILQSSSSVSVFLAFFLLHGSETSNPCCVSA